MTRLRFSMASLMGFVFLLAISLAALKSANALWAGLVTTLVAGATLIAILGLIYSHGSLRRFCTGFAVFGCSYFVFHTPGFQNHVAQYSPTDKPLRLLHSIMARTDPPPVTAETISVWMRSGKDVWIDGEEAADDERFAELLSNAAVRKPQIPATLFTDIIYGDVNANRSEQNSLVKRIRAAGIRLRGSNLTSLNPDWTHFSRVGHSLMALLVSLVGGASASLLFRTKPKTSGENGHAES